MTNSSRRIRSVNILLAGVLAAVSLAVTVLIDREMVALRRIDGWSSLLIVTAALSLTGRRRWPLATLAVATMATTGYLLLGYSYGLILVNFLVAVYTVARCCPPKQSAIAAGVALLILLSHLLTHPGTLDGWIGLVPGSAWVIVPYAIGIVVRFNRQALEQDRARAVASQLDEERVRLAQDVHDVVGHNLSAIKMQADIALHVMSKNPAHAEAALTAISGSSGQALDELRATLSVLLRPEETRSPTPGLARLDDLCRRMGAAGLDVRVEVTGTPRRLPDAIDVAGYRVTQEALTNVLRHSTARAAVVRLGYQPDGVTLVVSNPSMNRASVAADGQGLGVPGMRHRVSSLGGRFAAGPTTDRRFQVSAEFPTVSTPAGSES